MATSVRSSVPVDPSAGAAGRAVSARGAAEAKGAPAWQQVSHAVLVTHALTFINVRKAEQQVGQGLLVTRVLTFNHVRKAGQHVSRHKHM